MNEYTVSFPIAGVISFVIEAESAEEALDEAWEVDWTLNVQGECGAEIDEIQMLKHITTGNVCHAPMNDVQVVKNA